MDDGDRARKYRRKLKRERTLWTIAIILPILTIAFVFYASVRSDAKVKEFRERQEAESIEQARLEAEKAAETSEETSRTVTIRKQVPAETKKVVEIPEGTVLYDGDYAKITYQGTVLDKEWFPNVGSMRVTIENKCDKEIDVSFGEVAINGESYSVVSLGGSCAANAMKTVNYRSFGEPEIPYYVVVKTLSTTITIMDSDYNFPVSNYQVNITAEE